MKLEKVIIDQIPCEFVYDYREEESLRESFFSLAKKVHGLDFNPWYEDNHWQEKYVPFSIVVNGEVVSNASVNLCTFKSAEKTVCYIQIGTVMTREDYRHHGFSRFLISRIIEQYEKVYANIYLFANDTVLDFYPKFGFKRLEEYQYSKTLDKSKVLGQEEKLTFRMLNYEIETDRKCLVKKIKEQPSKEEQLAVLDNESLLMFYFQGFMSQAFYYIEETDTIVIMEEEEDKVILYDIYGSMTLEDLEKALSMRGICQITLGFTPKQGKGYRAEISREADTTLFVLDVNEYQAFAGKRVCFPAMSHA